MRVAVLSSVYGGYDERTAPPAQTIADVEWICVTDIERDIPGWSVVVEPRSDMHPRLAAKVPKCLPWDYTDADITIWIDGACQLLGADSLERLIAGADGHELAQFVHPWRDCIYTEVNASTGMPKYEGRPMAEQVEHYRKLGHPAGWGLWATGLIVRQAAGRATRERLMHFGRRWLAEQVRWTYQDQLSEAPVLRHGGMRPLELPGSLHDNGMVAWANHRDEL